MVVFLVLAFFPNVSDDGQWQEIGQLASKASRLSRMRFSLGTMLGWQLLWLM